MSDEARKVPRGLLAAMFLLPGLQTALAVHWGWHTPITYPALKVLMIALPVLTWAALGRSRRQIMERAGWKRPSLKRGLTVGVLMSGVILAGYYVVLRGRLDPAPVAAKARELGLLEHYWAMAVFVSLGNSLFEEYYWRAFLVGEMRAWTSSPAAVCVVCGALFGLHHVFAMLSLFALPWVAVFVAGTMVAGGVWSWMRVRGRSVWDCYVSHVLADLSIMWVGYDLISRAP